MKQTQDYCGVAAGIGADLIKRFTDKPFEAGSFHDHTQPTVFERVTLTIDWLYRFESDETLSVLRVSLSGKVTRAGALRILTRLGTK